MNFFHATRESLSDSRTFCPGPADDPSWPRITIITPSFNQAVFLERAIASIQGQGYPNLEHIVMDGGSTDGSVGIIRRFEDTLSVWHSGPDGGQCNAINSGAAMATGAVMTWINSDDMLLPGALGKVAQAFRDDPTLDLVYGNQVEVDAHDRVTKRVYAIDFSMGHFLYDRNIVFPQQSTFWRVDLFREMGGVSQCRYAMDYDLFYRFVRRGVRWRRLPDFLSAFRVHPASLTGSGEVMRNRDATLDRIFEDWTGRRRNLADRTVMRFFYRGLRFVREPRALIAAVRHRAGQAAGKLIRSRAHARDPR